VIEHPNPVPPPEGAEGEGTQVDLPFKKAKIFRFENS